MGLRFWVLGFWVGVLGFRVLGWVLGFGVGAVIYGVGVGVFQV